MVDLIFVIKLCISTLSWYCVRIENVSTHLIIALF